MSKPGKVLKVLCKKLGVRLTVKRGNKRVYKSIAVLKKQCLNKKKKRRTRKYGKTLLPKLRKISKKNVKHIYKLKDPHKKRILAIDEGIRTESKKTGRTMKKAAIAKKARFNVLRIYRKNKKLGECNKLTRDMRYIDKKYKLGKTKNICKRKKKVKRRRRFGTGGLGTSGTDLTLSWDSLGSYYGQHLDGKKHGLGALMYNNGSTYKGEWKDNKKHGEGKYTFANGSTYEGEFKDDFQDGYGKFTYGKGPNEGDVYEGEWRDDKWNGQGKYTFANGEAYEGGWKDGKEHGQGKFTFANGNTYEGEYKDGKFHGQGKYTFANGSTYEGEFKDDKEHGQGKYTFANGSTYEGEFKDGFQDGYGKSTWSDGSVYEGEYKDGKKHGQGKYTYGKGPNEGAVYEGGFKKDERNGYGKFTYVSGSVYEGEYKDGKKHGQGKYTWPDGRVYKGGWKDGKKHGQGVYNDYFYNNKIIKKGHWEYDKFKTGDLYKFKKDDNDESLNIFQHVKIKIDGDVLKSNVFGKDALNEFKKVLKSFMKEGFGKKRRKRKK